MAFVLMICFSFFQHLSPSGPLTNAALSSLKAFAKIKPEVISNVLNMHGLFHHDDDKLREKARCGRDLSAYDACVMSIATNKKLRIQRQTHK